jgi:hypothetical protein
MNAVRDLSGSPIGALPPPTICGAWSIIARSSAAHVSVVVEMGSEDVGLGCAP